MVCWESGRTVEESDRIILQKDAVLQQSQGNRMNADVVDR